MGDDTVVHIPLLRTLSKEANDIHRNQDHRAHDRLGHDVVSEMSGAVDDAHGALLRSGLRPTQDRSLVTDGRRCHLQPDAWYANDPALPEASELPWSFTISPGLFPSTRSAPILGRDLARWQGQAG